MVDVWYGLEDVGLILIFYYFLIFDLVLACAPLYFISCFFPLITAIALSAAPCDSNVGDHVNMAVVHRQGKKGHWHVQNAET